MDKVENVKGLPVFQDINDEYAKAESDELKKLLTELTILRACSDKQLLKNLGRTYDNKRNADGTISKLVGIYHVGQFDEKQADELLINGTYTLAEMWVVDKYADILKQLKF